MAGPVLFDAVTLFHFGAADRLDVLAVRFGHRPPPRWTQAVSDEVARGAAIGLPEATRVVSATWLGEPAAPANAELRHIVALQIGLNEGRRPPEGHAGEAESIHLAEKLNATFITDDNAAFDFAARRLGDAGVLDTVAVLRDAVAMDELRVEDAASIVEAIRAAGRHLRRIHPDRITSAYFNE